MNGIKWSQIEPDCDPESDRVLSVKPANAPGNSKKGKNATFWPKIIKGVPLSFGLGFDHIRV